MSWPLLVWLAGLLVLAAGNSMLLDPDTYWHTATGRWILDHGEVPTTDPFSHSMPGADWTAHEWLTDVIFSIVHALAGWSGLVVLTAAVFAATLAGLTRFLLRHLEPVHALMLVALTAGMLREHLVARPHVMAIPVLALWLAGLVNARDRNAPPSLWLIPLMTLWANLHGSFTFGLALAGAMAVEAMLAGDRQAWRQTASTWGRFLSLALLAAMLTPSHWKALAFTLHVLDLGKVLEYIGEWRSPDFHSFNVFEVWLIALLAAALSGRLRLPLVRLLLILGMVHLSLKHSRYIAVTGIVTPFLIAAPFARHWYAAAKLGEDSAWLDRLFAALARPAGPLATGAVTACSVAVLAAVLAMNPFRPSDRITPSAALTALRGAGIDGPIFNHYGFGGYLIYSGVPVFIDGRADMYGEPLVKRYVVAAEAADKKTLTELLDEFHIAATMLDPETPAVAVLDNLPGWKRLHSDETAVVHVRSMQVATR